MANRHARKAIRCVVGVAGVAALVQITAAFAAEDYLQTRAIFQPLLVVVSGSPTIVRISDCAPASEPAARSGG